MTPDTDIEQTDTSLTVRRTFDAPRERLWRAFTDPEDLAAWYAPGEMTAAIHAWEAEPGGELSISMLGDDGSHDAVGTFEAVVEGERLVHTWRWTHREDEPETRVTVAFRDVDGGTEVVLTHEGHPDADAVESHTEGWNGVLENLAATL